MEEYPLLPEYAHNFIDHLLKKGRKKSTVKRYYYDLLDFMAWVRVVKGNDELQIVKRLDAVILREYFLFLNEQREYSNATSKRVFTVIKSLFHFLHMQKSIDENPFHVMEISWDDDKQFTDDDFITDEEFEMYFHTLSSYDGLTEKQQKYRHLLIKRNEAISALIYKYGLSLQELTKIEMKDVHFSSQELTINNGDAKRILTIDFETHQLLYGYFENIPDSLKPRNYSTDHFFIAFDYQRGTYRFDYSNYEPKPLTVIAIQKMIRQEIKRSGIRSGISSHHLRRTAILNYLKNDHPLDDAQDWFGLKSVLTLNRYKDYIHTHTDSEKMKTPSNR
jgi:site-specific recombinase XerD